MTLNDIIVDGTAKFQIVRRATSNDLDKLNEGLNHVYKDVGSASSEEIGLIKLYNTLDDNIDGGVTQNIVSESYDNIQHDLHQGVNDIAELLTRVQILNGSNTINENKINELLQSLEGIKTTSENATNAVNESTEQSNTLINTSSESSITASEINNYINDNATLVDEKQIYFTNFNNRVNETLQNAKNTKRLAELNGSDTKSSTIELANVDNVKISSKDSCVELSWSDPEDLYYQKVLLARWGGTRVVRKIDSIPEDENDGDIVVDNIEHNGYQSIAYQDVGLNNGTVYYYRFFPYTGMTYTKGTYIKAIPNSNSATMSVSDSIVGLGYNNFTKEIVINSDSTGEYSIITSDSDEKIFSAKLEGNIITVSAVGNGSGTITIHQSDDISYTSPQDVVVSISVNLLLEDLNDTTIYNLQKAINDGTAANMWDVGDKIPIVLNGTLNDQNINTTLYAVILGFDHNTSYESDGLNSVHFAIGKDENDVDIALCDFSNQSGEYGNDEKFRMNLTNTTDGGWEQSYMRNNLCNQIYNLLPEEWKKIISPIKKYDVDNFVIDKIWIMSEYEIFGNKIHSIDDTNQQQYQYYINGNSKVRYNNNNITQSVFWWTRSIVNDTAFAEVKNDGTSNVAYASWDIGFVPCFAITSKN